MKKLIQWKDFLTEKQLDIFTGTRWEKPELKYGLKTTRENFPLWPMSIEEVEDLLFKIEESGYHVNVFLTFVDEESGGVGPKEWIFGINKRELTPTIGVTITPIRNSGYNRTSDKDLSYVLKSFINRVKPKFKKIEIYEKDGNTKGLVNLENVKIKTDIELELAPDDIVNIMALHINLIWYKPVYLTDKMIIQYHNLNDGSDITYDDKERAYITYPAEKYCNWLISSRDNYYDFISNKNGFDSLWEHYWDYAEQPDTEELFAHHLNIETIKLMVDYLIDDFEQIKEVDKDDYETLTGTGITSKEKLIERVQKVGLENIGELLVSIDSEFVDEFKSMYSDMTVSKTVDKVQDEIVEALIEVIKEQLQTEVTETEWKDGNPQITMQFNLDWLERYEGEDETLGYIIDEYISNNYLSDNRLGVYADYMEHPIHSDFNREVKSSIIEMMKRSGKKYVTDLDKT
jgi:hypothetical protein